MNLIYDHPLLEARIVQTAGIGDWAVFALQTSTQSYGEASQVQDRTAREQAD